MQDKKKTENTIKIEPWALLVNIIKENLKEDF